MLPLKRKLSSSYTCTAVSHTAPRDSLPDYLCQKDFRYKEPVQPFVEPSALIPLLGHHEEAAGGSPTFLSNVRLNHSHLPQIVVRRPINCCGKCGWLSLTLFRKVEVEHFISEMTHKPNTLRFWVRV
ncbi:hypothetical protein L195_g043259 [Trifolium pratense]|uniref:Uncharacterized protein n=1 Tax=Trifolium pratense TaxID=57577 RepID=A0A2K3M8T8_TRIPR|nr:hypothetical protein L195_g043259 [Trifolium pratense]